MIDLLFLISSVKDISVFNAYSAICKYNILLLFAHNPNVALYRETIYERVWGEEYEYGTKTVDLHIQRLRKKVGWQKELKAVNKVGYRLEQI